MAGRAGQTKIRQNRRSHPHRQNRRRSRLPHGQLHPRQTRTHLVTPGSGKNHPRTRPRNRSLRLRQNRKRRLRILRQNLLRPPIRHQSHPKPHRKNPQIPLQTKKCSPSKATNIIATKFGKRVSELYIDPASAVVIRDALKNKPHTPHRLQPPPPHRPHTRHGTT